MNRSGEEQERVLLYLEEEARKKHKRKLPIKNEDKWKGAGRGHRVGRASPFPPLHAFWEGCSSLRAASCSLRHPLVAGPEDDEPSPGVLRWWGLCLADPRGSLWESGVAGGDRHGSHPPTASLQMLLCWRGVWG